MIEIETIFQKSSSSESWICNDNIKVPNRAVSFGDGLFETMMWDKAEIRFFVKHLQRLVGGMQVLGLDSEAIDTSQLLDFLAAKYPSERKRVRWNVYRAGLGKYTPEGAEVFQMLQISEYKPAPAVKHEFDVSLKIQLYPTVWSAFKSLNSLPYVLANQERKVRELDEIILLDYRGYVSESGTSNIFWFKDGIVYTPSLSCSCINGVSRQIIMEQLDRNSIPYIEGEFELIELEDATHVFVSNCTGISYLEYFRGKKFSTVSIEFLQLIFD
ncbi:aminotransferase class IV [Algoriphagus sp. D3-2-R+10]|uniref:aminotransferase class IV n=1 Tax=Algoriphagus aurantiacus TaxID=3103948 RepID=UPI002B374A8A|nr:aminotransferase class IV [Algoriphagus sp. D3-2-R+10]MEB2775458.1 aminotransferase class IV [Algoriphagus sp. D3-2-R+10]